MQNSVLEKYKLKTLLKHEYNGRPGSARKFTLETNIHTYISKIPVYCVDFDLKKILLTRRMYRQGKEIIGGK